MFDPEEDNGADLTSAYEQGNMPGGAGSDPEG